MVTIEPPSTERNTKDLENPLPSGTRVRIKNSEYGVVRIVEYRGPLGVKGAHIYRVMVRSKPYAYIEVPEDRIEVA